MCYPEISGAHFLFPLSVPPLGETHGSGGVTEEMASWWVSLAGASSQHIPII